MITR
jgi:hypothetical protein